MPEKLGIKFNLDKERDILANEFFDLLPQKARGYAIKGFGELCDKYYYGADFSNYERAVYTIDRILMAAKVGFEMDFNLCPRPDVKVNHFTPRDIAKIVEQKEEAKRIAREEELANLGPTFDPTPKDILPTAEELKEAEEFHRLRKEEQKREPGYIEPGADGYTNELGQYYKGGVLFAPLTDSKYDPKRFNKDTHERLPIGRKDNGELYYYTDEEEQSDEINPEAERLFDEAMAMAPLI